MSYTPSIRTYFFGCKDPVLRLNFLPSKSTLLLFGTKSASILFPNRPHSGWVFHLVEILKFLGACLEVKGTSSPTPVSKPRRLQDGKAALSSEQTNRPSVFMKGSVTKQCVICFRSDQGQEAWRVPLASWGAGAVDRNCLQSCRWLLCQELSSSQFCSQLPQLVNSCSLSEPWETCAP